MTRSIGIASLYLLFVFICVFPARANWYFKPGSSDYTPSGMPDFDQRQDDWGQNPDTLMSASRRIF